MAAATAVYYVSYQSCGLSCIEEEEADKAAQTILKVY